MDNEYLKHMYEYVEELKESTDEYEISEHIYTIESFIYRINTRITNTDEEPLTDLEKSDAEDNIYFLTLAIEALKQIRSDCSASCQIAYETAAGYVKKVLDYYVKHPTLIDE